MAEEEIKINDIFAQNEVDSLSIRVTALEESIISHGHDGRSSSVIQSTMYSANFKSGDSGWQIKDNGDVEFNEGTFRGAVDVASINIPNSTAADSFHVDSSGNTWWGTNVVTGYATAPAYVLETGDAKFNNVAIAGTSTVGGRLATIIGGAIDSSGDFINDLINANLNTSAKTILGDFTFGVSGAIKMITDANNGLWISPTGILGKKAGVNTFTIDTGGNATFAGTLSAPSGTIGGWTIGATTLTGGLITLDSFNSRIKSAVDVDNYVELYGNATAEDSYIHGQIGGTPSFYFGYKSGGTYNILNNLRLANNISTDPLVPNFPYAAFLVDSAFPNYLRLDVYNSDISIAQFYFNGDGSFNCQKISDTGVVNVIDLSLSGRFAVNQMWGPSTSGGVDLGGSSYHWKDLYVNGISLNGDYKTAWPSGGAGTLSALTIDTSKNWGGYAITGLSGITCSSGGVTASSGTIAGNRFNQGASSSYNYFANDVYLPKLYSNNGLNVIDFSQSGKIILNQHWAPDSDNARTCGIYNYRWSDVRTVQINGVTPLAGTKVYYVANSSGGAVTRKLTFIDGILQSET